MLGKTLSAVAVGAGPGAGLGAGGGAAIVVRRGVGKSGSALLPQPGQVAVPSVLLLQLTRPVAATSAAPARASRVVVCARTGSPQSCG